MVQVLPAWVAARMLVLIALAVAHGIVSTVRPGNTAAEARVHQGLLAWDGGWYQSIAAHGYVASGMESVRFFPGYPMVARAVSWIPGVGIDPALLIVANVAALAAMAALVVLVRHDFGDTDLARRSGWLLGLAPSAYTLVMGYADGLLLLSSIVALLAARTRRWWWAAAAGLAAGLLRPVGILVMVPMVIEAWQARSSGGSSRRLVATGAAVAGPMAGTGVYLLWVSSQFHSLWLPFRVQQQSGHRGSFTFPLTAMWHNVTAVLHGHHLGSASHVPWVLLSLVLLVITFRRLPLSYAVFAAAVLAVSMSSSNLDSFERYALGAFPLVVAASTLTSRRAVETVVLAVTAIGMGAYAILAFLGAVVP